MMETDSNSQQPSVRLLSPAVLVPDGTDRCVVNLEYAPRRRRSPHPSLFASPSNASFSFFYLFAFQCSTLCTSRSASSPSPSCRISFNDSIFLDQFFTSRWRRRNCWFLGSFFFRSNPSTLPSNSYSNDFLRYFVYFSFRRRRQRYVDGLVANESRCFESRSREGRMENYDGVQSGLREMSTEGTWTLHSCGVHFVRWKIQKNLVKDVSLQPKTRIARLSSPLLATSSTRDEPQHMQHPHSLPRRLYRHSSSRPHFVLSCAIFSPFPCNRNLPRSVLPAL